MILWLILAAMSLLAAAMLVWPLLRRAPDQLPRDAYDLEIYRDQLAELDGRKIKYDKRLAWNDTMVQLFFEDPNGVIIELGYDAAKEGVTKENYESVPA